MASGSAGSQNAVPTLPPASPLAVAQRPDPPARRPDERDQGQAAPGFPTPEIRFRNVGDALAHQINKRALTELILFIRPSLVKDAIDGSVIAEVAPGGPVDRHSYF